MAQKVNAFKKMAVALGYGNASDYTKNDFAGVLKQFAVKAGCADDVENIRCRTAAEVMEYIAANYGNEEHEPYNLAASGTHVTIVVKRKGKTVTTGADKLYNGDVLTITATADDGYDVTALTVNGVAFTSGNTYTVNGHNVTIAATTALKTFDLERTATNCTITATKGGEAVSDGENVLTYGDEITITATAADGYTLATLTVNGEAIESGDEITVAGDVEIVGTATADETDDE